jgi:hypothetical protein
MCGELLLVVADDSCDFLFLNSAELDCVLKEINIKFSIEKDSLN